MTDHTEMRETMREVLELAVSDANRYSSREPVRLRAVVALRWDHPWLSVFAACALIDAGAQGTANVFGGCQMKRTRRIRKLIAIRRANSQRTWTAQQNRLEREHRAACAELRLEN